MCKDFANFVDWLIHLGANRPTDKPSNALVVGDIALEKLKKDDKFVCSIDSTDDCCTQVVGVYDRYIVVYSPQIEDDSVYALYKGQLEMESDNKPIYVSYDTLH